MTKDYYEFELVPTDEDCAQVGEPNYGHKSRLEYNAIVDQLTRFFGPFPDGVYCRNFSCDHDFGPYYELRIYYNSDDDNQLDFVYGIDCNFPDTWDTEALEYLEKSGYFIKDQV